MVNSDSKSKIEKWIAYTHEKISYWLLFQDDCVLDPKRVIFKAQKRLESLNSFLALAKLI